MKSWGQTPTGTNVGNSVDFPGVSEGKPPSRWPEDHGLKGSVNDRPLIGNGHPHQAHSVGYHDSPMGSSYDNHGFNAVPIVHGQRGDAGAHMRGM